MENYKNKHYQSKRLKEEHHSHKNNVRGSAKYLHAKLKEEKAAVQAEKARLRAEILERNEIRDRIRQEIEKKQESYSRNMIERRSRYSKEKEQKDWDKRRRQSRDRGRAFNDDTIYKNRRPEVENKKDDCLSPKRGRLEHREPQLNRAKNREQESPHDRRRLDDHRLPDIVREENLVSRMPSDRRLKNSPSTHGNEPRRQATEPERKRMKSPSEDHHRVTYPREEHRHNSKSSNGYEIRTKQLSPIQMGKVIHLNSRRDPDIIREPRLDDKKRIRHSSPPFEGKARSPFIEGREEVHDEKRSCEIRDLRRTNEERFDPIYIDRQPVIRGNNCDDVKLSDLDRPPLRRREDKRPNYIKNKIRETRIEYKPTYETRESNRSTLLSEEMRNRQMDDVQPLYMREKLGKEERGRPLHNDRTMFKRESRSTSMDRPTYMRQEMIDNRGDPPRTRELELTNEYHIRQYSPPFEVKTMSDNRPSFTKEEMRGKQIDRVRPHYKREEVSQRRYSPLHRDPKLSIKDRIGPPFKKSPSSKSKDLHIKHERRDSRDIRDSKRHDTKLIRKSSPPYRSRPTDDKTSTFNSENRVYLQTREPERLGRYSPAPSQRLIDSDTQHLRSVELRDDMRDLHDIRKVGLYRGLDHSSSAFDERVFMTRELDNSARTGQHVKQRWLDDNTSPPYEKEGHTGKTNASASIGRIPLHEDRLPFSRNEEMRITTRVSGVNEDFTIPISSRNSGRRTYELSNKGIEANVIGISRVAEPGLSVQEHTKPNHYINDQQQLPYIRDPFDTRGPLRFSPAFGHQENYTNMRKQPRNREVRLGRDERTAQHRSHEELYIDEEILRSENRWKSEEESWDSRDRRPMEHQHKNWSKREIVLSDPALNQRKTMERIPATYHQRSRDDSLSPHHDHIMAKSDWKIHQRKTREARITGEESDSSSPPYDRRLSETNVDVSDADKMCQEEISPINRFYLIRHILEGQHWRIAIMRTDKEPIDMNLANAIQASIHRKWKETSLNRKIEYPFSKTVLMTSGYFLVTSKNKEAYNWLLGVNLGSLNDARLCIIREYQIARVRVTVLLDGFGRDDPSVPHEPLKNIIFQNDYRKGLNFHLWSLDKFYKTTKCGQLQILIDVDSAVTLRDNPNLNFELSNVRVQIPEKIILEPKRSSKLLKYPF